MKISFAFVIKNSNERSNEPYIIYIHSENSSVLIGYEIDNIIEERFNTLLREYQESLKTKMKKSDLVFDSVNALYYKPHKIRLNRGGSYIDPPEWVKNKKSNNKSRK